MANTCLTLTMSLALFLAVAGRAGAAEPAGNPGVSFDGDRIHIDVTDQPLEGVLEIIGAREGFAVVNLRPDTAAGTVSGVAAGHLSEVLPWLLDQRSHVLVRDPDPESRPRNAAGIQRIILMGPPLKLTAVPSPKSPSIPSAPNLVTGKPMSAEAETLRQMLFGPDSTRTIRPDYTSETPADNQDRLYGLAGGGESLGAGKVLASAPVDPGNVVIERSINLSGDVPLSSHVTVLPTGGGILQRTASNQWVPWDGSEDSLIDNGIEADGDSLRFSIDAGDLSEELFPVTFTLAYRTAQGLKYGVVQAVPDLLERP